MTRIIGRLWLSEDVVVAQTHCTSEIGIAASGAKNRTIVTQVTLEVGLSEVVGGSG